ncbi:hypothetical protein Tsubulata_020538 [Turnera subulata]|uniref:Cytochrome P450 n=1 Tax=Turnera subulata TaxID=218843 RepID=A0A9Q0FVM8_9ROSI|nr:hypothetical protein Tsubulata_020538 [Turnera subulata]
MALLILFLAFPLFLFLFKRYKNKTIHLPPGPNGLPLVGNLHQLDSSNRQKYLWQLSRKYGPLVFLRLGFKPTLVVSSAIMAKEILQTYDLEFCSRPVFTGQRKLSYNNLDFAFAPYNAYWREMRKMCVVHLFNSSRVQRFRPIREEEVSLLIGKIWESASAASKPFDLSEALMSLNHTIICRIAFGKSYEDGGRERARIQELILETQVMLASFFLSDYFPCMGWADRIITGLTPRLEKNFKEMDAFYQEIIDEHLDPKKPKPPQEDMLDVLLQIYKDSSFKVQLTFEHIKAILMNVYVPGTDTSAATVTWAMSFLMKNPLTMEKAQREVRSLVGNKGFVNEDDLEQLPYLKAVIKEAMRLQPPVPLLLPREATRQCKVGGYQIPAKT